MSTRFYNPFQGIDISIPVDFHQEVLRYSQRESKPIIDNSPFRRMVDMWFLAVCIAVRKGLAPADISKYETKKVIEGSIFSSDPWRVHALMLIAISHTEGIEIVAEPRKMITIANGFAVAGMPHVLSMLKDGDGEPIWNLSEEIEKELSAA